MGRCPTNSIIITWWDIKNLRDSNNYGRYTNKLFKGKADFCPFFFPFLFSHYKVQMHFTKPIQGLSRKNASMKHL